MSVYITKPFLPPKEEYLKRISGVFDRSILTNQGPEVNELEDKLKSYLGVRQLHYVTNGTIAIQIALRALGLTEGEIITTPFSFVATTSAILWEHYTPVFVDIEPVNFTIDPEKIEAAITKRTKAIMPVHVYGYACNIEVIEEIARRHGLKVIYDAAHAFGSRYKGKSLASYGDISTLSFHATKLFHTIEGGACICNDNSVSKRLDLIKRFGILNNEHYELGINAKQSEINAAMGIVNLKYINNIIDERKRLSQLYDNLLEDRVYRPAKQDGLEYNYAYYPVLFNSEKELIDVFNRLASENIFPRRYFYPSLNNLPYLGTKFRCPVSEELSSRIACLPLFVGLEDKTVFKICEIISQAQ